MYKENISAFSGENMKEYDIQGKNTTHYSQMPGNIIKK